MLSQEFLKKLGILGVAMGLTASPLVLANEHEGEGAGSGTGSGSGSSDLEVEEGYDGTDAIPDAAETEGGPEPSGEQEVPIDGKVKDDHQGTVTDVEEEDDGM